MRKVIVTEFLTGKAWPSMPDEAGFADRMNNLPKYVASTTLKKPPKTLGGGTILAIYAPAESSR